MNIQKRFRSGFDFFEGKMKALICAWKEPDRFLSGSFFSQNDE